MKGRCRFSLIDGIRFSGIAWLALVLSACAGSSMVPEDHFYRLPAIKQTDSLKLPPLFNRLGVAEPEADGLYRERAAMYVESDRPLELKRYHYRHWVYSPPVLIQQYLHDYLQASKVAGVVVKYSGDQDVDEIIGGRILRFERLVGNTQAEVLVTLELYLQQSSDDNGADGPALIFNKQYSRQLAVKDNAFYSSAELFGEALQQIFQQFVEDAVALRNS